MSKVKVAPSILSADFAKMAEAVQNLDKWHADVIHCDVMDGVFVPNITFGMDMIKALRKYTNGILDVHLMIIKPEKYIPQFIAAGADVITFHPVIIFFRNFFFFVCHNMLLKRCVFAR